METDNESEYLTHASIPSPAISDFSSTPLTHGLAVPIIERTHECSESQNNSKSTIGENWSLTVLIRM